MSIFSYGLDITRAGSMAVAASAARDAEASAARSARAAYSDYDYAVSLLAAVRRENAILRAALESTYRDSMEMADEIAFMRAAVGAT